MKFPSKAEKSALVYAYAVMAAAARSADMRTQQKTFNKYSKLRDRLAARYPHVDLSSEAYDRLISSAGARVTVRGPGVDW